MKTRKTIDWVRRIRSLPIVGTNEVGSQLCVVNKLTGEERRCERVFKHKDAITEICNFLWDNNLLLIEKEERKSNGV